MPPPGKAANCLPQSTAVFDRISVSGNFKANVRQLAMIAGNNATLLEGKQYAHSTRSIFFTHSKGRYSVRDANIATSDAFTPQSLIHAGIFGLVW